MIKEFSTLVKQYLFQQINGYQVTIHRTLKINKVGSYEAVFKL